jgi:uncharacterized protein YdiU (UPF0061 family)
MDEQVNKKNIICVFLLLIMLFLFIYKGIILSGEEYLEEYIAFRNQAEKQTFLKKLGKKTKSESLEINEENDDREKLLGNLLTQLDNVKLELEALGHVIKNKKQDVIEKLDKLNNDTNKETIKEVIENIKNTNDQTSLENITEILNVNIKVLRNYIKNN